MSMSNTEKTVKDIRVKTRRKFSTEENIRSGTNLAEYRDYYVTGTWFDNHLRSGCPSGLLHCSDLYPGNSRFSIGGRREIESVLTPK
jgi:hypothetical protein